MPYVKDTMRELLNKTLEDAHPTSPGELNYCITVLIRNYAYRQPLGLSYTRINDVIGALEGAKLEFYRRVAAPYEDTKIEENGDVY